MIENNDEENKFDLKTVVKHLIEGKMTIKQIRIKNPKFYRKYKTTLYDCVCAFLEKNKRTEMTKGYWYYEKSGCDENHIIHTKFPNHYIYHPKKQWENYNGQDTVIFNNFKGEIEFDDLMEIVDKWDCIIYINDRRTYFISKNVIIISSKYPEDIYKKILTDTNNVHRFYRRFQVINLQKTENDIIVPCLIRPKIKESVMISVNDRNPKMKKEGDEWVLSEEEIIDPGDDNPLAWSDDEGNLRIKKEDKVKKEKPSPDLFLDV